MRNCNIIISLLLGYAIASGIELNPICRGISKDDGSCICGSMSPGWLDEYSSGDAGPPEDFQCLYKQQLVTGMFSYDGTRLGRGASHAQPHTSHLTSRYSIHRYLTSSNSPVTFLWNGIATAEGFSIGFAPEYFFPILICFIISTVESIGPPRNSAQFGAILRSSAQFGAILRNSSDPRSIPSQATSRSRRRTRPTRTPSPRRR